MALRVLSLNLWNDAGPYEARAKQIREWIDRLDPDLIGFQEALSGRDIDQVPELLSGREYFTEYVAASPWRTGVSFGNAVASRWPIRENATLELPDAGDGETRAALCVTVDAPIGPIAFTTTHLNWRFHHGEVRERQVVALCDWVRARRPRGGFPPILVGDFNADPDSAEIRYVSGLQSLAGRSVHFRDAWRMRGDDPHGGITWSNRNDYARDWLEPDRRIDYVFAGPPLQTGVGLIEACTVVCDEGRDRVWPSDHFGVYAELRTEPVAGLADRAS